MTLRVADSFLLDDGRVRGLDLHRERFAGSCAAEGVATDDFWADTLARLPRGGRWFPRVELSGTGLSLRLRTAPPLGGQVAVSLYDGPDPRVAPKVKGPDLDVLGNLKALAAKESGADEVLLTSPAGTVLEAAYSGLLWWEGDTLCVPPGDLPILPSVTVRLLRGLADERGVEVAERARTLPDLAGQEAWLVSALHGIRPVATWLSGPPAGPARRAADWQLALRRLARPLPPAS